MANLAPSTPISLTAMIIFGLALPRGFYMARQRSRSVESFDFVGGFLLLAASVLVVFGLQQGGVGAFAWNSAVIIATLAIGCICCLVLFAWEWSLSQKTMDKVSSIFPLSILARRTLAASIL